MFENVRDRLGSAGLVVAVIALIAALAGGAYAASNSGNGSKATASAKGKRGPRGPKGAPGAQGAQGIPGSPGAPGPKGDTGAKGDKGDQGIPGAPGSAGKNVKLTAIPPLSEKCSERGGVTAEVEGVAGTAKDICNGVKGDQGPPGIQGPPGNPWTPESQLPPGATETGAWAFTGTEADTGGIVVPISFTVQLGEELFEEEVHFQSEAGFSTKCKGTVSEPAADPGQLCVYFNTAGPIGNPLGAPVNATFEAISGISFVKGPGEREPGANRAGAALFFKYSGGSGEAAYGNGSWAVTAPLAGP